MELTQQQKLEILSAYLPYGVDAFVDLGGIYPVECKLAMAGCNHARGYFESKHFNGWSEKYKLILRHPDDMTEEEFLNFDFLHNKGIINNNIPDIHKALRYLHSRLIDTFGAIEAGFAVRKTINEKGE